MNDSEILKIIQEESLTVRCLPKTVTSLYNFTGKYGLTLKENQKIIEKNGKKYVQTIRGLEWPIGGL